MCSFIISSLSHTYKINFIDSKLSTSHHLKTVFQIFWLILKFFHLRNTVFSQGPVRSILITEFIQSARAKYSPLTFSSQLCFAPIIASPCMLILPFSLKIAQRLVPLAYPTAECPVYTANHLETAQQGIMWMTKNA